MLVLSDWFPGSLRMLKLFPRSQASSLLSSDCQTPKGSRSRVFWMDGSPRSIPRRWQLSLLPTRRVLVEFRGPQRLRPPADRQGCTAEGISLSSALWTVWVIRVQGIGALSEKLNSAQVSSSSRPISCLRR